MSQVEKAVGAAMRAALPDVPVYEGVVVEGYHPMTLRGVCLDCERPDYAPGCKGEGAVPREVFWVDAGTFEVTTTESTAT